MKTRLAQETKLMRIFQYRVPLVAACLPIAVAVSACNQPPATPPAAPAPAAALAQTPAERGKMLVTGGLCHDCHTPKKLGPKGPEPDMDKMLSGHPEGIKIAAPYKRARRAARGPSRRSTASLRGVDRGAFPLRRT